MEEDKKPALRMNHYEISIKGCFDSTNKDTARQIAEDIMKKFNKLNHPHGRNFECMEVSWSDELEVIPNEPPTDELHPDVHSEHSSPR